MKGIKFEIKIAMKSLYLLVILAFTLTFNNNILYAQEAVEYVEVEEVPEYYALDEVEPAADPAIEAYEPPYVETNNTRTYFIIAIVVLLFVGIIGVYYLLKKKAQNTDIFSSQKIHQICPKCGTVNPEGSMFCQNCGTKLDVITE